MRIYGTRASSHATVPPSPPGGAHRTPPHRTIRAFGQWRGPGGGLGAGGPGAPPPPPPPPPPPGRRAGGGAGGGRGRGDPGPPPPPPHTRVCGPELPARRFRPAASIPT